MASWMPKGPSCKSHSSWRRSTRRFARSWTRVNKTAANRAINLDSEVELQDRRISCGIFLLRDRTSEKLAEANVRGLLREQRRVGAITLYVGDAPDQRYVSQLYILSDDFAIFLSEIVLLSALQY